MTASLYSELPTILSIPYRSSVRASLRPGCRTACCAPHVVSLGPVKTPTELYNTHLSRLRFTLQSGLDLSVLHARTSLPLRHGALPEVSAQEERSWCRAPNHYTPRGSRSNRERRRTRSDERNSDQKTTHVRRRKSYAPSRRPPYSRAHAPRAETQSFQSLQPLLEQTRPRFSPCFAPSVSCNRRRCFHGSSKCARP